MGRLIAFCFLLAVAVPQIACATDAGPNSVILGFISSGEVKTLCDRRDSDCLRVLEGAISAAVAVQEGYRTVNKLPPMFCLEKTTSIEDLRTFYLKYITAEVAVNGEGVLENEFAPQFLAAVIKAYPCANGLR